MLHMFESGCCRCQVHVLFMLTLQIYEVVVEPCLQKDDTIFWVVNITILFKWWSSSMGRMTSHIWNGTYNSCLKPWVYIWFITPPWNCRFLYHQASLKPPSSLSVKHIWNFINQEKSRFLGSTVPAGCWNMLKPPQRLLVVTCRNPPPKKKR